MHRVQMPGKCLSDDAAPIPVGLSNALGALIQYRRACREHRLESPAGDWALPEDWQQCQSALCRFERGRLIDYNARAAGKDNANEDSRVCLCRLPTTHPARSRAFYEGVLGLTNTMCVTDGDQFTTCRLKCHAARSDRSRSLTVTSSAFINERRNRRGASTNRNHRDRLVPRSRLATISI